MPTPEHDRAILQNGAQFVRRNEGLRPIILIDDEAPDSVSFTHHWGLRDRLAVPRSELHFVAHNLLIGTSSRNLNWLRGQASNLRPDG